MMKILKGDAVTLKPIQMEHTSLIVKWRNAASVRKNFVFQDDFTEAMHIEWMNTKVSSGEVIQYIIYENSTGLPVGSVYYRDVDKQGLSAEYGIFIGEECARGKGYGTETAKLFIEFGAKEINLHRIMLRVFSDNVGAIKSYKRAGFEEEGIARDFVYQNKRYRNMMFMSIIIPGNVPIE